MQHLRHWKVNKTKRESEPAGRDIFDVMQELCRERLVEAILGTQAAGHRDVSGMVG
jgi:hypothetical protein